MKIIVIFLIIFGFATFTIAAALSSDESEFVKAMDRTSIMAKYYQPQAATKENHIRAKRYVFTCESIPAAAACVMYCLDIGSPGGYCSPKLICTCR